MSTLPDTPQRLYMPSIAIGAGEICDLGDAAQAADWSYRLGVAMSELRRLKNQADEALRGVLEDQAATHLQVGDLEVSEQAGQASYDVTWLMQALVDAGMPEDVMGGLFEAEWKVRDAKELQKLENRHQKYAAVIAQARTRKRGRLTVKRKRQQAPAPQVSESVHRQVIDEARATREAEAEASELGI